MIFLFESCSAVECECFVSKEDVVGVGILYEWMSDFAFDTRLGGEGR